MQMREMRYARIEGTEVMVEVHSAEEAKAAIRELRHKKKELQHARKRLVKEQKGAKAEVERVARRHSAGSRKGGVTGFVSRIRHAMSSREPLRDLALVEADLSRTDDILHHIDSCIIQLEGRLL
jgi:hypothetical protein